MIVRCDVTVPVEQFLNALRRISDQMRLTIEPVETRQEVLQLFGHVDVHDRERWQIIGADSKYGVVHRSGDFGYESYYDEVEGWWHGLHLYRNKAVLLTVYFREYAQGIDPDCRFPADSTDHVALDLETEDDFAEEIYNQLSQL